MFNPCMGCPLKEEHCVVRAGNGKVMNHSVIDCTHARYLFEMSAAIATFSDGEVMPTGAAAESRNLSKKFFSEIAML